MYCSTTTTNRKDLLTSVGIEEFEDEDFDASEDICKVLVVLDNLESEFDALLKINDS